MDGLFLWATAGWMTFLVYAHYWWKYVGSKEDGKSRVDTIGAKQALWGVGILAGWIVVFGILSGALGPDKNGSSTGGGIATQVFVGIISALALFVLTENLIVFLRGILPSRRRLAFFLSMAMSFLMLVLLSSQAGFLPEFLPKTVLSNNIFLIIFFALVIVPLGFSFRRSGILTIFSLIMLLDIYLVWLSGQAASSDGKNWYVAMIQSDLMQNWPIPIAFFDGRHMLGGGDMGFIAIGLVFIYREFGKGTAILFALLSTLPLLLLPSIRELLDLPQMAWPYTIFIAPWAILLCLVSWWRQFMVIENSK